MALEREEIEHLSGLFTAQSGALRILIRLLHKRGVVDAHEFIAGIEQTFNQPDARFDRQSYMALQKFANLLAAEIAEDDDPPANRHPIAPEE